MRGMITDRDVAQFRELGYFVTEPALDPAQLAEARSEFERLWRDEIAAAEASRDERRIRIARHRAFIGQAHTRSVALADLVHAPIYREACARLIGPDADLYWNQVVIKSPQRGAHFGWHQDSGYTTTVPLAYITCWTAITRATLANGCIWIIPGSHHRGLLPHARNERDDSHDAVIDGEAGAIPVELRPGQVAIFSSLLLHKSGPNTSDEVRFGYVPQYHHAGAKLATNGELFGDQVPVLRGGQPVRAAAVV
jgi:ectoine hydroxylase-related dioxygenase (phytanoyl-CoA dioxygenase family)